MTKKVNNLNERRRKRKPRTLEESAKAAYRRYFESGHVDPKEEPEGLASGKTTESGSFVDDDEGDDEDRDEDR